MIGTTEAALRLGISTTRVRQLLISGRIKGTFKKGNTWQIPIQKNGKPKIDRCNKGPKPNWLNHRQRPKTRIHVNQHKIKSNCRTNCLEPVISILEGQKKTLCNKVRITGSCQIVYNPTHPLSCGARVWIELDQNSKIQYS